MNKENNCPCAVCNVEAALLDSFSTQSARIHFQALATNYPVLNHFSSPVELVEHLHEQGGTANQNAGSEILHALIHAITERPFEVIGQQLLLLAFTPAIHKIFREMCQRVPMLAPDDIAQQTWLVFLQVARSPALLTQNGQLPVALAMNCHKAMLRLAIKETRCASAAEDSSQPPAEPLSEDNFEDAILLEDWLKQAQRKGLLSEEDYDLLLKLKYEGLEAKELAEANGMTPAAHRRLHRRLQTILNRLQREARGRRVSRPTENSSKTKAESIHPKKNSREAVNFAEKMPFSNSEKGFSPELSRPVPQFKTDATQISA